MLWNLMSLTGVKYLAEIKTFKIIIGRINYICTPYLQTMMTTKIFNNTKRAFSLKTDAELNRAIFLFQMIGRPFLVKIGTSLTTLSLKLRLPVEDLIKKTIFNQFCGGVTEEDCIPTIRKIYTKQLHGILDYSVEGKETETEFEATTDRKLNIIKFISNHKEVPYAVFKPTGIGAFEIWEKVSQKETLTAQEATAWNNIKKRVDDLCQTAVKLDVRVLVDGEESWMQDAADELIEEMMAKYNKERAMILNTIQCYRWDRLQYIKDLHERAKLGGFKVGAKIVRGAYMEKENDRASRMGYPTPICEDKEATDVNFNAVMTYIFNYIEDFGLFVGSHNEVSNYLAMQLMEDRDLAKDDDRIWFGQLYGMSDHISFNLATEGYNTCKLIPFGPVRDVVPYLIRRAQENTSVKGQTGRELALLLEEKARRKGSFTKTIH